MLYIISFLLLVKFPSCVDHKVKKCLVFAFVLTRLDDVLGYEVSQSYKILYFKLNFLKALEMILKLKSYLSCDRTEKKTAQNTSNLSLIANSHQIESNLVLTL